MNRAPGPAVDFSRSPDARERPLASWYTQGRSDGLGDRLLMSDNTGKAALELLRFRPEIAATYGFESALRERVECLDRFRHPAFPRIHAVEYLEEGDGLALVSTHTPGKRVSDLFQASGPRAEIHPAFATWLIHEITSAIADLQAQQPGLAHGALTGDRILLTPERRIVIVEHVVGSALECLDLSAAEQWSEIGVVAVPSGDAPPPLDSRADVVQIALIALSVLLGRRITPVEYPGRLGALLDEFSASAVRRSPALSASLRLWLDLALRTDGAGFKSAREAQGGLARLSDPPHAKLAADDASRRRTVPALAAAPVEAAPPSAPPPPVAVVAPPPPVAEAPPVATAPQAPVLPPEKAVEAETVVLDLRHVPSAAPALDVEFEPEKPAETPVSAPPPAPRFADAPAAASPDVLAYREIEDRLRTPHEAAAARWRGRLAPKIAAALAVVALAEAAALVFVLRRSPGPGRPLPVPLRIDARVPGDVVLLDGQETANGALSLTPGRGPHTFTILHREPVTPPVPAPAPPPARRAPARPAAPAAPPKADREVADAESAQPSGVRVVSPIDLQVLEDGRVLGSSTDGAVLAAAGTHQLEFVNAALGYRSRQTVQIKPGEIRSLAVTPPSGRISVNAVPWAQVWIDGNPVGETPLANLPVPAGEHEIVFRHPQFGEHHERAVVRPGALTRVSATLGR